ncbi:Glutaminase kidney isoform [Durusdinium trenchii]|uniref:glutaminase n=1 Tax=Durusdinium trenchii TaxID=1381693 RepID=A0ABP0H5D1_9DINO
MEEAEARSASAQELGLALSNVLEDPTRRISVEDLVDVIRKTGLSLDDERVERDLGLLLDAGRDELSLKDVLTLAKTNALLETALSGNLVVSDFEAATEQLNTCFESTLKAHNHKSGKVCPRTPKLSRADPEKFAASFCSIHGQRWNRGDSDELFTVMEACGPLMYCTALELNGVDKVHEHIGREPSGRSSRDLALDAHNLPHNPFVSAGLIMCAALIKNSLPLAERFNFIKSIWSRATGQKQVDFANSHYLSQRKHSSHLYCLAYMLKGHGSFPREAGEKLNATLDFLFMNSCIQMSSKMLATFAATLAGGGVCPTTNSRVFSAENVQRCLSMMSSCGMNDFSGSLQFSLGFPCKSSTSGFTMVVIPNLGGFCTFNARIDESDNSVFGLEFSKQFVKQFGLHTFGSFVVHDSHVYNDLFKRAGSDPDCKAAATADGSHNAAATSRGFENDYDELFYCVAEGNIEYLRKLYAHGVDMSVPDYDLRTPLHIAASAGHIGMIKLLCLFGANPEAKDRFGNTPLDDAKAEGHDDVIHFLEHPPKYVMVRDTVDYHVFETLGAGTQIGDNHSLDSTFGDSDSDHLFDEDLIPPTTDSAEDGSASKDDQGKEPPAPVAATPPPVDMARSESHQSLGNSEDFDLEHGASFSRSTLSNGLRAYHLLLDLVNKDTAQDDNAEEEQPPGSKTNGSVAAAPEANAKPAQSPAAGSGGSTERLETNSEDRSHVGAISDMLLRGMEDFGQPSHNADGSVSAERIERIVRSLTQVFVDPETGEEHARPPTELDLLDALHASGLGTRDQYDELACEFGHGRFGDTISVGGTHPHHHRVSSRGSRKRAWLKRSLRGDAGSSRDLSRSASSDSVDVEEGEEAAVEDHEVGQDEDHARDTPASGVRRRRRSSVSGNKQADPLRELSVHRLTYLCSKYPYVERILQGHAVVTNFEGFSQDMIDLYDKAKEDRSGHVASYIPQLARQDPEKFGIAVCTVDAQRFSHGDAKEQFCVQSCMKTISYCIAQELVGEACVHRHVAHEPSGRNFNELMLNSHGLPHNPLINAGAIMTASLILPDVSSEDRFDYVTSVWEKLSGGVKPGYSNETFLSEMHTADRNRCLGYLMKEKGAFPAHVDSTEALEEVLEFYFQMCSLELDCEGLSVVAATLANGGVCPVTQKRVFRAETVRNCLSIMASAGMYDYSGEWQFTIGVPAKSGVAGALLVVVPNVMGVCTWAPRLDKLGNSARGIAFCKLLQEEYTVHRYSLLRGVTKNHDLRDFSKSIYVQRKCQRFIEAATRGDIKSFKLCKSEGVSVDCADYDGRTPLHLAASEGHLRFIRYLLQAGANVSPIDRWGRTPLDDASHLGHDRVVQFLLSHGAKEGLGTRSCKADANEVDQQQSPAMVPPAPPKLQVIIPKAQE